MTDRELMQQALEWIEAQPEPRMLGASKTITALRKRLAQPERTWVELTAMEIDEIGKPYQEKDRSIRAWGLFACAIENQLKEKNK